MDKKLLERYFKGEADKKLKAKVIAWASASEENGRQFIEAKTDWSLQHFPNEPANADDHLHFANHVERLANTLNPQPSHNPKKRNIGWGVRIAAIITIPILLTLSIQSLRLSTKIKEYENGMHIARLRPEQTQTMLDYIVNPGVKGKVLLPDSSEVWLNSHSVLRCPNRFDSINRMVELNGEGYFKIKGNPDWPFFIHTQKGVSVKVVGTEFNLSSYSNDPFLKVTLIKGEVMLIDHASLQTVMLQPMEEVVLKNNIFKQVTKSAAKSVVEDTSWKEGFLLFDNTPMDVVIRKMERWYGVTVSINNARIAHFRITAEFDNESLTQVLEILKISSDIKYKVDGTHVSLEL